MNTNIYIYIYGYTVMQGLLDSKRIEGSRVGDYIGDNYRDFKGILGIQGGSPRLRKTRNFVLHVRQRPRTIRHAGRHHVRTAWLPHYGARKHFFSQCPQQ